MRLAGFTYDIHLPEFCFSSDRASDKISPWYVESSRDCTVTQERNCCALKVRYFLQVQLSSQATGEKPPCSISFLFLFFLPWFSFLVNYSWKAAHSSSGMSKTGDVSWKGLCVLFWQFSHTQNRTLLGSVINTGIMEYASSHVLFRSVNEFCIFKSQSSRVQAGDSLELADALGAVAKYIK